MSTFSQLLQEEKPREKLLLKGAAALCDFELLALLLKTGTKQLSVIELSKALLENSSLKELSTSSFETLSSQKGISTAKACELLAVFELSKRLSQQRHNKRFSCSSSQQVYEYFYQEFIGLTYEKFKVVYLDAKLQILHSQEHTQFLSSQVEVSYKYILKRAIELNSHQVLLLHNHPSGDCTPSQQDKEFTSKVAELLAVFDITLVDHVIICEGEFFSFIDKGLL